MNKCRTRWMRKARGAFFTPPAIAQFLVDWAVRERDDRVLEPSCGEAAFLLPAGARLRQLGASPPSWSHQLCGIEIHPASASAASDALARAGTAAEVVVRDFFACPPRQDFDVVVGNPPYIRYQHFTGLARSKSLEAALSQGVRLSGLASSWAAFVIHAAGFLKPDGRLAVVLPAELLTVGYAAEVRRFLLRRFAKVRLVMFEQRIFQGVLEEVVLLLAEGTGGAGHFELHQASNAESLSRVGSDAWTEHTPGNDDKWTPALLPAEALTRYRALTASGTFSTLSDWGSTYLGAVTGSNAYFALTTMEAAQRGIDPNDCVKISPPGSRHLAGLKFTTEAWQTLVSEGERCLLFPRDPARASRRAGQIRRRAAHGRRHWCEEGRRHLGHS